MTSSRKIGHSHSQRHTPLRAIREKCLACCYGDFEEVASCPAHFCSLHPYRFGKNPKQQLSLFHETD